MKISVEIYALLAQALSKPALVESLKFFLDWSPELKHEGLVSTHISAHLRCAGLPSRREVSIPNRRVDFQIGPVNVEAKYHVEGDLIELEKCLPLALSKPIPRQSATNAILSELKRGKSSFFLWHVCVRSPKAPVNTNSYKYESQLSSFYSTCPDADLRSAVAKAEVLIDNEMLRLFRFINPRIETFPALPRIDAAHSALISRLYYFPDRSGDAAAEPQSPPLSSTA